MIDLGILKAQARVYNDKLDKFVIKNELPKSWFDEGYDHLGVKTYNLEDYEATIENFKKVSELITEVDLDGRHIATARLLGQFALGMGLSIGIYVYLRDIEIMLARPGEQSQDFPILDHSEIYIPRGSRPVEKVLDSKNIRFLPDGNEFHKWVSVVFNEEKDEVKFTDRRLSRLNDEQIRSGRARIIHDTRDNEPEKAEEG